MYYNHRRNSVSKILPRKKTL